MKVLKRKEVTAKTGLSTSTIQRYEKRGIFPLRRRLSAYRVGWLEHEIDEWIESRGRAEAGAP